MTVQVSLSKAMESVGPNPATPSNKIQLCFSDVAEIYEREQLKELDLFCSKTESCYNCQYCTKEEFELVLKLASNSGSFYKVINDVEKLLDAAFMARILDLIKQYCPNKKERIYLTLCCMPVNLAKEVRRRYLISPDRQNPSPSVQFASEVVVQALYFETEEKANSHFKRLIWVMGELTAINAEVKRQAVDVSHASYIQERFCQLSQQVPQFLNSLDPLPHTMLGKECASRYQYDKDPLVRAESIKAYRQLTHYKLTMLDSLQLCAGTNMHRADLLKYLLGPKAYLLDYYGIRAVPVSYNPQYPFTDERGVLSLGYQLNNPTPEDLEEEIRSGLEKGGYRALPPRLLSNPLAKTCNSSSKMV